MSLWAMQPSVKALTSEAQEEEPMRHRFEDLAELMRDSGPPRRHLMSSYRCQPNRCTGFISQTHAQGEDFRKQWCFVGDYRTQFFQQLDSHPNSSRLTVTWHLGAKWWLEQFAGETKSMCRPVMMRLPMRVSSDADVIEQWSRDGPDVLVGSSDASFTERWWDVRCWQLSGGRSWRLDCLESACQ